MLRVVALICSLSTPVQDCDRSTALDVIPLKRSVSTPTECVVGGQEQIAETGIVVAGQTYLRLVCERPR